MNRAALSLLRWLIALAMPVLIVLLAARIMVNPWYAAYEYGKPDFPPDPYGFTQAERLELGTINIDFLNSPEPPQVAVSILEALKLPGTNRPLFNRYELSHMVDVKRLTDILWRVLWVAVAVVIVGGGGLLAGRKTRRDGYAALFTGGLITTIILVVLILSVLLAWRTFFIAFHDVFFPPGSWTFEFSDSLIRLFPDRFWFDAGVLLVGGALAAAVLVTLVAGRLSHVARRAPQPQERGRIPTN